MNHTVKRIVAIPASVAFQRVIRLRWSRVAIQAPARPAGNNSRLERSKLAATADKCGRLVALADVLQRADMTGSNTADPAPAATSADGTPGNAAERSTAGAVSPVARGSVPPEMKRGKHGQLG